MAEMMIPAFLQNRSFENILTEMIGQLPEDIDISEGSHPYNLLAPTAYETSRMAEFVLMEAIKLIFPKFCADYDEYVDYHAETCGIARKKATKATGSITITGKAGTEIPAGSRFSTVSVNGNIAVEFISKKEAVIDEDGIVEIFIEAVESGKSGNVAAGTVILMSTPINGVNSVVNELATSGGLDEETSEALVDRIAEYEAAQGMSFVGNIADYKRWALEVDGVGSVQVIDAQDGSGLVTLIISDRNGEPAKTGDILCESVYKHIMSPDDEDLRLAPCGARLSVVGPETIDVSVSATVWIDKTIIAFEDVIDTFFEDMAAYLIEAANTGSIVWTKVGSLLSEINGVKDYENLKVNNDVVNIPVLAGHMPRIRAENITLTEVT